MDGSKTVLRGERLVVTLDSTFALADRIAVANVALRAIRRRGARQSAAEVDRELVARWLGVRPGQRLICTAPGDRNREIHASDAGIWVKRRESELFVGWDELDDLVADLVGGAGVAGWFVTTRQGVFVFDVGWRNAAALARAIQSALAEQAVGHRLPAAADADVPLTAISVSRPRDDSADRGIGRV
ncbi:MAG: hypothetical protein HYU66_00330 [Armatimonadetes bacterium]|nr:hypothetical protein [Armatimonadota bacterium]